MITQADKFKSFNNITRQDNLLDRVFEKPPVIETNNNYSVISDVFLIGLRGIVSVSLPFLLYDSIKDAIANVKNTNQCCKLVRMSMNWYH